MQTPSFIVTDSVGTTHPAEPRGHHDPPAQRPAEVLAARPPRTSRRCPGGSPASRCRSRTPRSSGRTSSGPGASSSRNVSQFAHLPDQVRVGDQHARRVLVRLGRPPPASPTARAGSRRAEVPQLTHDRVEGCPAPRRLDPCRRRRRDSPGSSATSGSRLFSSIRRTASCGQPFVERVVPRGARTGRGPDSGAPEVWVVMPRSLGPAIWPRRAGIAPWRRAVSPATRPTRPTRWRVGASVSTAGGPLSGARRSGPRPARTARRARRAPPGTAWYTRRPPSQVVM